MTSVRKHSGYCYGKLNSKRHGKIFQLKAHRIAWALHYGEWPDPESYIDHIDGDRSNNKIENLREVTPHENAKNKKRPKNNTTGHIGIRQLESKNWQAYITVDSKFKSLGSYEDKFEAMRVRKEAEKKYGFHENHGASWRD